MKLSIYTPCEYTKNYFSEILKKNNPNNPNQDSGLDLVTSEDIIIPSFARSYKIHLKTYCSVECDTKIHGYYLYPRSSISKTPLRMANSVGVIDYGYRGEIMACVDNISNEDYMIEKGTRLFQLCAPDLSLVTFQLVDKLSDTDRGIGGFGSTGK